MKKRKATDHLANGVSNVGNNNLARKMPLRRIYPKRISQYHVFLASPGDVLEERQSVRRFFDEYNRQTAHIWNTRFEVVDWENYATAGVGRPQDLITQKTLEKYRGSLALVIGVMGQRFGSPTGKAESGTEEEFNWAMESHKTSGFPEIKWFFRKIDELALPPDPDDADAARNQWEKILAFRDRMKNPNSPVFYVEYPDSAGFAEVFAHDMNQWLADSARPWVEDCRNITKNFNENKTDLYQNCVTQIVDALTKPRLDTVPAQSSSVTAEMPSGSSPRIRESFGQISFAGPIHININMVLPGIACDFLIEQPWGRGRGLRDGRARLV